MGKIEKLEGIVIKKIDYKENGNLITVLTRQGSLPFIVRGSKKISGVTRNYTNLLTKMQFNATSNMTINTLTEANIITSYINIYNNVDKINVMMAMLEKINFFTEEMTNQELFYDFVCLIFDLLEKTQFPYNLLSVFETKLLYLLGVAPGLKKCIICDKENDDLIFSVENGGLVCPDHGIVNSELNEIEVKALKLLYYIKPDKVDDDFLKLITDYNTKISFMIDKFYERHLDFSSKAKKIISIIK